MVTELTTKLDKIFHERARLGIMSMLVAQDNISFTELASKLDLTRGNLSVHMKVLEDNGYITVTKEFIDKKPRTTYSATPEGRKAFTTYLELLEKIIKGIQDGTK